MDDYSPTAGFEEYAGYPADVAAALANSPSKSIPFGAIGSMLSNMSKALGADKAPDPGAYYQKVHEAQNQFGQSVGFGRLPGGSNQAGAVALNPLNVTAPLARPGEIAIRALSGLYR